MVDDRPPGELEPTVKAYTCVIAGCPMVIEAETAPFCPQHPSQQMEQA